MVVRYIRNPSIMCLFKPGVTIIMFGGQHNTSSTKFSFNSNPLFLPFDFGGGIVELPSLGQLYDVERGV